MAPSDWFKMWKLLHLVLIDWHFRSRRTTHRDACIFSRARMWKHPLSLSNDPVHRDSGYLCAAVYEGWFISWLQLCTEWSEHWVVFWQHGWISQWLSATQQANWTQAMLSAAFLKCGQSDFREGMIPVSFVVSVICTIVQCLTSV